MIKEFITDVCELLEIKVPKISYDTTHFATKTTLSQCEPVTNTIYLKFASTFQLPPDAKHKSPFALIPKSSSFI